MLCIQHLDQALAVQPLVATAWYLRGIASMQVQDWAKALDSFVRCIQQDIEVAEAYANMGAIYMRQREFEKAHDALKEALKYKGESWKITENLLNVCLALGKWKEAIAHMDRLLNMRSASGRPIHKKELRYLIEVALASEAPTTPNEFSLPNVLESFLKKVITSIHVDSEVWDILATFYEKFNRPRELMECRFKEVSKCLPGLGPVSFYGCLIQIFT
jgi:tetratricopeptide (TPR) repeat protein